MQDTLGAKEQGPVSSLSDRPLFCRSGESDRKPANLVPVTDRRLAIRAWESLFRAQHEVYREVSVDFDGDSPLSQSEYDVLLNVTRAPEMTLRLREVTQWMLVSQPSVSRLIDKMVTRGLITKSPDPLDGRGALIHATESGASMFRQVARRHATHLSNRMSVLDSEELATLHALTQKLRGTDGPAGSD